MKHYIVSLIFVTLLGICVISLADPPVDSAGANGAPPAATTAEATPTPAPDTTPAPVSLPLDVPDTSAWPKGNGTATPSAGSPTAAAATRNRRDMLVSMNFERADIGGVLKFLSAASETPIVVDAEIRGTITIVCPKQVPLSQAYEVINSALRVRGFTMIGGLNSDMIRVVTLKKAVAEKLPVTIGANVDAMTASDEYLTQIIPLKNISASRLREELKALVPDDQGNMVASSATNSLIVTDTAGNIRRIAQIVAELDKDASDILEVEIYACQYASADALVAAVNRVFPPPPAATAGRGGQPQQGRGEGGQPQQPAVMFGDGPIDMKGELRVAADARTNSVIISAARPKINLVLDMLKKLDVDTTPEVKARTFTLIYADADMVANQLNRLFEQPQGGTGTGVPRFFGMPSGSTQQVAYAGLRRNVVVADVRTNSVIITATEQNMRDFEAMILSLDAPKVLSETTRVFPLKYANATDLARTMNSLFRGTGQQAGGFFNFFSGSATSQPGSPLMQLRNITIVAETKTNSLLVTGPPQSFGMVESMIVQLDKRPVQVFIQVAIVDVTLDDSTKFGVEWSWNNPPDQSLSTDFGQAALTQGLKYSVISGNLKALLHTLESRSNVKVYSTPSITTADNVQARISIGRDVPFVTSEVETTGGQFRRSVDFKNIAIALTVTPHVNESSNLIALDVYQTINELIGREAELNAPIIASREARTTVMVNDGQTIVIGGIMKENRQKETRGVPGLSRIPLLGHLFKSTEWVDEKSELMVFLTPHILRDEESIDRILQNEQNKLSNPLPPSLPVIPPASRN